MKFRLIYHGDEPLTEWAAGVQAQLVALDAGTRGRWRRFRRCDVICERCREQLGQVMGTTPPVLVTRRRVPSYEHPHAQAMADELGDPPGDDDPDGQLAHSNATVDTDLLAARHARVSSTVSWWLTLDMLPEDDDPMAVSFELHCKCRSVSITRAEFLAAIDGKTHVLM